MALLIGINHENGFTFSRQQPKEMTTHAAIITYMVAENKDRLDEILIIDQTTDGIEVIQSLHDFLDEENDKSNESGDEDESDDSDEEDDK